MTQLDPSTRRALLAVDDPPRGVQDRIYRAIVTAGGPPEGSEGDPGSGGLGSGDPGSGGLGSGDPGSGGAAMDVGFAAKVVGATIGLTSAGVALLALTSMGIRAINRTEPAQDRVAVDDRSGGAREHTSVGAQPDPLESATTSAVLEPSSAILPDESEHEPSATTASEPSSPSASPSSTLEAELALMKEAREAVSPATKLAALERHRDQFSAGVLADEREVLRVETLCALGRTAEAEVIAAAFIAAKPSNPLRSRVEPACSK
jgi:hypothetical protein